jgi:hypothetical protein
VLQIATRRLRGGLEELVEPTLAMVEQYPLIPAWRCGLAYVYRELERLDEAREQLEVIAADDFSGLTLDGNWKVGAAILATVCASLDDRPRAEHLYAGLAPFADTCVIAGLPADVLGCAHHFLMLLAATLERWDDVERHAAAALAGNAALGAPAWVATTQHELAVILVRRNEPGDLDRARGLLNECLAACDELGMPYLAGKARRALEEVASSA